MYIHSMTVYEYTDSVSSTFQQRGIVRESQDLDTKNQSMTVERGGD